MVVNLAQQFSNHAGVAAVVANLVYQLKMLRFAVRTDERRNSGGRFNSNSGAAILSLTCALTE